MDFLIPTLTLVDWTNERADSPQNTPESRDSGLIEQSSEYLVCLHQPPKHKETPKKHPP
jgi:hypothetical protein